MTPCHLLLILGNTTLLGDIPDLSVCNPSDHFTVIVDTLGNTTLFGDTYRSYHCTWWVFLHHIRLLVQVSRICRPMFLLSNAKVQQPTSNGKKRWVKNQASLSLSISVKLHSTTFDYWKEFDFDLHWTMLSQKKWLSYQKLLRNINNRSCAAADIAYPFSSSRVFAVGDSMLR